MVTTQTPRAKLERQAVILAWLSVAWNAVEAVVALVAGRNAGSMALVGFGLDSIVEAASALVIIWQFAKKDAERERQALKLIAVSFFLLAGFVGLQALLDLWSGERPQESRIGIGLAVVSLIVMPLLARAKRRTGLLLGSRTVTADSKQTMLCTYLSAVLLGGLLMNAVLGWWWADPVAGLAIAALAIREGRSAWQGDECNC